jgi:hypothetical protein
MPSGTEVTWRFFSLEELNRNEGKKHPWDRPWSYGWSLLRIAAQCDHSRQVAAARAFDDCGTWRGNKTYAMTVSASPDSSSCGTWPKAYLAAAVRVNVQIMS